MKPLYCTCAALIALGCAGEQKPPAQAAALPPIVLIGDAGLQTPESVLPDAGADVYIVSNINGAPLDKDDNGFISRLAPDGRILSLKWIDGAAPNVTLHAPKGMALKADTLFVADIDVVRLFHRTTGAPLGERQIAGATFLNDMAVGTEGTIYVTDSGLKAGTQGFAPSGTDAVYRFDATGRPVAIAKDTTLGHPNGIIAESTGLTVVTFGSGEVYRLDPVSGARTSMPKPPAGALDGVVRLADGSLLISSWDAKAVFRLPPNGAYAVAVDSVEAPADIGYDATRMRVLIPLFTSNRVVEQHVM